MKEFVLIFRLDCKAIEKHTAPDEIQSHLNHWQDWFRSLAADDRLARPVQHWEPKGKVVQAGNHVVTGPYSAANEPIVGLIIIKASDYQEALCVASTCPVLEFGGSIEIRMAT
ncbi:YciI family protein [Imperialibacter roseus]|uniref:YciI family protein n=1 Tax=Imperialibacter roseus TaxID=1324217 RepID=A0ABZ0ITI4_9BACT|nr:YciI family protein [Imperialibacter roseus]WOK08338.1 YciI family protein [Imperialibacter roseus]